MGRSSRPTALFWSRCGLMPQGIDVSIRHYLLTLKDLGIYSAPLQKQGSLSLRRCWDGREELGSLRKKLAVGPSF